MAAKRLSLKIKTASAVFFFGLRQMPAMYSGTLRFYNAQVRKPMNMSLRLGS